MNILISLVVTTLCLVLILAKTNLFDISCHTKRVLDDFPLINHMVVKAREDNIYFLETSCRGTLNPRQACSVESTARANPSRRIFILFAGPVNHTKRNTSPFTELYGYENIHFFRIYSLDFAEELKAKQLFGQIMRSRAKNRVHQASEALRFLTLSKFCGTYLDLDMIVMKSFNTLPPNWVVSESLLHLGSAAFSLSDNFAGRKLASQFLRTYMENYNSTNWAVKSIGAITKVVETACKKVSPRDQSKIMLCQDLHTLNHTTFFPFPSTKATFYFHNSINLEFFEHKQAYAHHLWNGLTEDVKVERDSLYAKLSKQYCPNTYKMYKAKFGYGGNEVQENDIEWLNSKGNRSCVNEYREIIRTIDTILPDTKDHAQNNIFFVPSSCNGTVVPREACAVESAARLHPDWKIYVTFIGNISGAICKNPLMKLIDKYNNINLTRLTGHTENILKKIFIKSENKCGYSDILTFLLLYKFGGTYLDLNKIAIRSFNNLPKNWVIKNQDGNLRGEALKLSSQGIGKDMSRKTIHLLKNYCPPLTWEPNIAEALTEAFRKICTPQQTEIKSARTCQGIEILEEISFYPPKRLYSNNFDYLDTRLNKVIAEGGYVVDGFVVDGMPDETQNGRSWSKEVARDLCPVMFEEYFKRVNIAQ